MMSISQQLSKIPTATVAAALGASMAAAIGRFQYRMNPAERPPQFEAPHIGRGRHLLTAQQEDLERRAHEERINKWNEGRKRFELNKAIFEQGIHHRNNNLDDAPAQVLATSSPCMPAVQEAQQRVMAQTAKERFKENRAASKEAMKRNKAYQELTNTMPDLIKRAEKELDTAWQILEVLDSKKRVKDVIAKNPKDGKELTLTIENCRGSMDRAAELLGQEPKSLGWNLLVAGELNNLRTQTKKLKTWIEATEGMDLDLDMGKPIAGEN